MENPSMRGIHSHKHVFKTIDGENVLTARFKDMDFAVLSTESLGLMHLTQHESLTAFAENFARRTYSELQYYDMERSTQSSNAMHFAVDIDSLLPPHSDWIKTQFNYIVRQELIRRFMTHVTTGKALCGCVVFGGRILPATDGPLAW
jgi:hypothetical protein